MVDTSSLTWILECLAVERVLNTSEYACVHCLFSWLWLWLFKFWFWLSTVTDYCLESFLHQSSFQWSVFIMMTSMKPEQWCYCFLICLVCSFFFRRLINYNPIFNNIWLFNLQFKHITLNVVKSNITNK